MDEAPEHIKVCAEHGLRYDGRAYDGCVLCRRGSDAAVRSIAPEATRARGPMTYAAIGIAALLVLLAGAFAISLGSDPSEAVVDATVESDADPLGAYLAASGAELDSIPLREAEAAMNGLSDEARAGTLDSLERRRQIRAVRTTLEAQRRRIELLDAPPEAVQHRLLMIGWYNHLIAQVDLCIRMTEVHDRTVALVATREQIRTREDALRYDADVERQRRDLNALLRQNGEIERETLERGEAVRREDARLRELRPQPLSALHGALGTEPSPSP